MRWYMSNESYCLDAENAKNLLKNREIDKAYADELKAILEGLR